jgi:hypothetical protein
MYEHHAGLLAYSLLAIYPPWTTMAYCKSSPLHGLQHVQRSLQILPLVSRERVPTGKLAVAKFPVTLLPVSIAPVWIKLVVGLQSMLVEDFEFYGIYESDFIGLTISFITFKPFEYLLEVVCVVLLVQVSSSGSRNGAEIPRSPGEILKSLKS